MEILDVKNTVPEFIISLDGFNRRVNTTEEKIRDLEDIPTEAIQNEAQRTMARKIIHRASIIDRKISNGLTYVQI